MMFVCQMKMNNEVTIILEEEEKKTIHFHQLFHH